VCSAHLRLFYENALYKFTSDIDIDIRSGTKVQLRGMGSAVSSPSGAWGGATAEIEFGAF